MSITDGCDPCAVGIFSSHTVCTIPQAGCGHILVYPDIPDVWNFHQGHYETYWTLKAPRSYSIQLEVLRLLFNGVPCIDGIFMVYTMPVPESPVWSGCNLTKPVTVQLHQPEGLLRFVITAQAHPWALEAIATVTRTENRENMCGQGWKFYSGKCYILVKNENPKTFIQDEDVQWKDKCGHLGGQLLEIQSQDELIFIHHQLIQHGWTRNVHVPIADIHKAQKHTQGHFNQGEFIIYLFEV